MSRKTVIIGGVAAGTKAGAKLKRACPQDEVVLYTKSADISYAGCGLPYYVGGGIEKRSELIVHTPEKFSALTGVEVHTKKEATGLNPEAQCVTIDGRDVHYDELILAVGADPILPPLPGINLEGVFKVRTPDDAEAIRAYAENCRTCVVVGGGFIGLEMAENLMQKGLEVTVLDLAPQLLSRIFDPDMADFIRRKAEEAGLHIQLNTPLSALEGEEKVQAVLTPNGKIPADMVILSLGIRPATAFLQDSGLLMERGLILTDTLCRTNLEHVYAVGDCAMVQNRITQKKQWSAMGSTANIAARTLALTLSGEETPYQGCLGTGVIKLSERWNAARTGLTEEQAADGGFDPVSVTVVGDDKAHYYPGANLFITKLIADRQTHRLLGAQIVGSGAVDKMNDIAVVGITAGLKAEDFITMDFSYAPPFSTAISPFATACAVLLNKLTGKLDSVTPGAFASGAASDSILMDAHPAPVIAGAPFVNLSDREAFAAAHPKDEKMLLVCARGKNAYLTQNKLRAMGYTHTKVLEGGLTVNPLPEKQD